MHLASLSFSQLVHAFAPLGVQPLRAAYRYLVDHLDIDAVVLVDGGTDVLLRGDEADLGTPVEDITSLAAVAALDVPVKLVTSLGFGIDAYDGVNQVQVLESLAARCLYLDRIENTIGRRQVITRIQTFRDELLSARVPRAFPTERPAGGRSPWGHVRDCRYISALRRAVSPVVAPLPVRLRCTAIFGAVSSAGFR
ncbi:DUF1152 domain-containing protein [Micromonospora sp. NPDC051196]|uniref:DUF1152 domain-containing protein n=1 Tax=Micromonospora sp. NPDC051196 TaxID=3155281 RepID=UPI003445486B